MALHAAGQLLPGWEIARWRECAAALLQERSFAARTAPLERHSPSKLGSYSKALTIARLNIGLINNAARHWNHI